MATTKKKTTSTKKSVTAKKQAVVSAVMESDEVMVAKTAKKSASRKKSVPKKTAAKKPARKTTTKVTAKKVTSKKVATPKKRATAVRTRKATVDAIVRSLAADDTVAFELPEPPARRASRAAERVQSRRSEAQHERPRALPTDHHTPAARFHRAVVFAEFYLLSTVITIFVVGAITLLTLLFSITV